MFLMPQYDRCLAAAEASPGADVVLAECESSELTSWEYSGSRLRLESRPELCLTIGEEPAELTPGGQRAPTRYVARSLGLEPCAREATARQLFTISPPLDIPERLTPEMAR